jgi:hypothetical protein
MGYDSKYGKVTTEHGDIPADEPVIVFRARDALTVPMLKFYAQLCQEEGSPPRHVDLVRSTRDTFQCWQNDHPDQVRTPDSERSREWLPEAGAQT